MRGSSRVFRLTGEAIQAFDILKAKSGSRSGPRLAAEMIDLLLIEHGEKPVGPLRPGAAKYPKVISHGVAVYVSSRPRESHPEPLTEPCVNLSIYTALVVRPCSRKALQWANNSGSLSRRLASHSTLRRLCRDNVLYLRLAHRSSFRSKCRASCRMAV